MRRPTRDLERLRAHAVARSLFSQGALEAAIRRLGFVQADPIRSPARAQDLILRHRAEGYRAGELERRYPGLEVEEDLFYAYGFLDRSLARLLHPRPARRASALEVRVLETVRRLGETHPAELEDPRRVVNAWGGRSKATKCALERLHHRGLLRVVRRDRGVRVYEPAPPVEALPPEARLRGLVLALAELLAPAPEATIRSIAARLVRRIPRAGSPRETVSGLLRTGELERAEVDGLAYVWPPLRTPIEPLPREVRFLAPFDPVVWDRRRFEHLWGWAYRFEAYTPPAKRLRGYYAMPLLWGDDVVGWANASRSSGRLDVDVGFAATRPRGAPFREALDAEVARLDAFLDGGG